MTALEALDVIINDDARLYTVQTKLAAKDRLRILALEMRNTEAVARMQQMIGNGQIWKI